MPVPVGDVKQFDAAKCFAHLQRAGRKTASMDGSGFDVQSITIARIMLKGSQEPWSQGCYS